MQYTTLFFDLDDTLYDSRCGLWTAIRGRMSDYMLERLGLPQAQVPALRRHYYETYGTTLRGLQRHHAVDVEDFLHYVHDVPLAEYLQPAPQLRDLLLSLPQRRWIFTNADSAHAQRVLGALNLDGCFDGIIDIRALEFVCKPEEAAYRQALRQAGEIEPRRCVFFDDSANNLAAARVLGFVTVLVGANTPHPAADYVLPDLLSLPGVLPGLWTA